MDKYLEDIQTGIFGESNNMSRIKDVFDDIVAEAKGQKKTLNKMADEILENLSKEGFLTDSECDAVMRMIQKEDSK
jgi:hypothetical protein